MMEKEIYIHIGYPKTATTTLQENLFPNHTEIEYLRKDNNNFKFIHDVFFSRETSFKINKEKYKKELVGSITNKKKYVYSEESLTSFSMFFRFHPKPYVWTLEPNSIARKLKIAFKDTRVFTDTKIIVSIRKQDDMLRSMYAQVYNFVFKKFAETKSFKKFLQYAIIKNRDNFIVDSLHYNEIISEYEFLFGRENICVLVFEEMRSDKDLYIKKLCDFIGIDFKEALELLDSKHKNHRSSSNGYKSDERNMIEILSFYKNKYLGDKKIGMSNSWVYKILKRVYIPGKVLSDLNISESNSIILKELYSKGNKELSERYGLDLDKYGYYYE